MDHPLGNDDPARHNDPGIHDHQRRPRPLTSLISKEEVPKSEANAPLEDVLRYLFREQEILKGDNRRWKIKNARQR
jgi:hypothetical protein